MSLKRKQMLLGQKEHFEQKLKDRKTALSGKGIESARVEKDPIVRKLRANVNAMNNRLKAIAASEKITADMAKLKADRAAAVLQEKEETKAEKPRKAAEPAKEKKPKAEKKPAPERAPEGGKAPEAADAPEGGKTPHAAAAVRGGKPKAEKKAE
jgi:hypothetical protein